MRRVTVFISGALSVCLAFAFFNGNVFAQTATVHAHETLQNIVQAVENGEITSEEAILQKLYAGFAPDKVEARFFEESDRPIKCMTPVLMEYEQIRDELPPQTLMVAESLVQGAAPERAETGQVYYSSSGNFALHYQTEGRDAVPADDTNGSGIPDYIEKAAAMADSSYRYQVETIGFHDFLLDEPYVIHFQQMGYFGLTRISGQTTEIDIHNNFNGFPENNHPEGNRYGSLYVTIAHEIKHAIQFAANQWDGDAGRRDWTEMDATMMEEVVHPDVDDYYNYLMRYDREADDWNRNSPNSNSLFGPRVGSITRTNPHRAVPGAYYHVTWMLYFYETYGIEFWRDVWDRIGEDWSRIQQLDSEANKNYLSFFDAVDQQLRSMHSTLASGHVMSHAWHASAGPLKSGFYFGFEDSDNYPNPALDGGVDFPPDNLLSEKASPMGASYYSVIPRGVLLGQPSVRLQSDTQGVNMAVIGFFHGGHTEVLQLTDPDAKGGVLQSTWNWGDLQEIIVTVVNNNRSQIATYDLHIDSLIPDEDMISHNYPNPFQRETTINFSVNRAKNVRIEVFDVVGRKIQTVADQEFVAGFHSVNFEGNGLASGMYFYRIITDQAVISNKMMLVR